MTLNFTKLNDQFVRIKGLHNGVTEDFVNTCVVTATLKTKAGVAVAGFTNVTLVYETGTDGWFLGQVEDTFDPAKGSYVLWLDMNQSGLRGHYELACRVNVRNTLD